MGVGGNLKLFLVHGRVVTGGLFHVSVVVFVDFVVLNLLDDFLVEFLVDFLVEFLTNFLLLSRVVSFVRSV